MSRFVSPLRRRSVLAAGAGTALLAACGTKPPPPPKPTLVKGTLKASAGLNLSVSGRASPLQVRVYELKAPAAFNSADFMSLFQGDQAALGADMLSREEITLQPSESRPYNKTLAADTRFIGVVGFYRALERANWRTVVAIQPNQTQLLTISVGDLALAATVTVQP